MPLTESVNQESVGLAPKKENASGRNLTAKDEAKVCWIEVKRYPYQPDHQVELLHLQAEADALIIKLQNCSQ